MAETNVNFPLSQTGRGHAKHRRPFGALSAHALGVFFSRADFETQAKVTERVNNVDNFEQFDLLKRPFRLDVLLR